MSNYLYEEDTYKIIGAWLRYKPWKRIFWNCLQRCIRIWIKENKISFEREKNI
jgi:hypothetical protein